MPKPLKALVAVVMFVLSCTACGQAPVVHPAIVERSPRLDAIKRGLALRFESPEAAAEALSQAGVGPVLEKLRFGVWIEALERGQPSAAAWSDFLDQDPPQNLSDRAKIALAQLWVNDGRLESAADVLASVSEDGMVRADTVRLGFPEQTRKEAAARLAVRAPVVLRREASSLERSTVAGLGLEEKLERAIAWRESGHPRRGAAELRALRVKGPLETRRRLELARCELNRGSTSTALAVLPPLSRCNGEEAVVRASSWRRRGWSRYPGSTAAEAFRNCLAASQRARSLNAQNPIQALELQLECGTEGGALQSALFAWQALAEENWQGSRRSWLGRRLGVALAASVGFRHESAWLASSLKDDGRSIRFAVATASSPIDRETLVDLAGVGMPDLYALWSRQALGEVGAKSLEMQNDISIDSPPASVRWLIDLGEDGLASTEWRRLAEARAVLQGEALAAAIFEDGRGRPDLAIRWLRRGFADLGGTEMNRVSKNALKAYLPLRWPDELKAAAREFGLAPWLLAGLARQESIFNSRARSPAGARGVVQLMPGTARGHAVALGLGRSPDLYDPAVNLRLGARELARLIRTFGEIEPALAAYNAGESRVRKWWKKWPQPRRFTEAVPIPETYTYIRRVTFLSEAYRLVWAETWE